MPGEEGSWRLRGASLAVWSGEVVWVAGADGAALRALLACLRGAPAWGGLVRARPGWWRYGRVLGPLDVDRRAPDALARRLVVRARRAIGGALVAGLVVDESADAWAAVHVAAALAARHVPVRCVALRGGRVVPPPFR